MKTLDEYLKEQLKGKNFRKEWEAGLREMRSIKAAAGENAAG